MTLPSLLVMLLTLAVFCASMRNVAAAAANGAQELRGVEEEEVVRRQAVGGMNKYFLDVFTNWRTFRDQHCNGTYNDQPVSPNICKATLAKGIEAFDQDEYKDCSGQYQMDVRGNASSAELALYKHSTKSPGQMYYVFVKYGNKISFLKVPGSAAQGWQVVPLQGAWSEAIDGALDVVVLVYTPTVLTNSGFLSCEGVKSLFAVAGEDDHAPVLAVYTNASTGGGGGGGSTNASCTGSLTYDEVAAQQGNHSYVAQLSSMRSECATRVEKVCYSNVTLSFRTSDKANSLEVNFAITPSNEKLYGTELALYLNANTNSSSYQVYVYRKKTPVQFTLLASKVIPANRANWQTFGLDALLPDLKPNTRVNVSMVVTVEVTPSPSGAAGLGKRVLTPAEVRALLVLSPGSAYSPIVMAYYAQSVGVCNYLLCRRDIATVKEEVVEEEEVVASRSAVRKAMMKGGGGGGGRGLGDTHCHVESHLLDLRALHPNVVYPHTVDVGSCVVRRDDQDGGGGGGGGDGRRRCIPTQYRTLHSLQKEGLSYRLVDHVDLVVTKCGTV